MPFVHLVHTSSQRQRCYTMSKVSVEYWLHRMIVRKPFISHSTTYRHFWLVPWMLGGDWWSRLFPQLDQIEYQLPAHRAADGLLIVQHLQYSQ